MADPFQIAERGASNIVEKRVGTGVEKSDDLIVGNNSRVDKPTPTGIRT